MSAVTKEIAAGSRALGKSDCTGRLTPPQGTHLCFLALDAAAAAIGLVGRRVDTETTAEGCQLSARALACPE